MTPIPDIDELARGVLVFPMALNGANRRPHHLDTMVTWAGPHTWPRWQREARAALWEVIALHLYLNPGRLDWRELYRMGKSNERDRSVATLFAERLDFATAHLPSGNLRAMAIQSTPQESKVGFADFARWAQVYSIPLPGDFPSASTREAARSGDRIMRPRMPLAIPTLPAAAPAPLPTVSLPSPVDAHVPAKRPRKPRTAAKVPSEYMRLPEVVSLVGCSPATLWRWVKDGEFPKSVKLGKRITGWPRDEVDAWLLAKANNKASSKKAAPPAR